MYVVPTESTSADWSRPSSAIWGKLPTDQIIADPIHGVGFHLFEDFTAFPCPATNTTGSCKDWRVFCSDGGTILDGGIANVSSIKATSNDDNEAVVMSIPTAGIRITRGSGRKVAFEARVRFDTISDTKNGAFFGLFEPLEPTATSHIGDDGAMVDKNFIGFHRLEGDGDKIDIVYKADGQDQQSFTDALTLVADTWYKIGFLFDGDQKLYFYLDGARYTTADIATTTLFDAATFPDDINLSPAMVLHKAATGTTEGTNYVDWVRFAYTNIRTDGLA